MCKRKPKNLKWSKVSTDTKKIDFGTSRLWLWRGLLSGAKFSLAIQWRGWLITYLRSEFHRYTSATRVSTYVCCTTQLCSKTHGRNKSTPTPLSDTPLCLNTPSHRHTVTPRGFPPWSESESETSRVDLSESGLEQGTAKANCVTG